MEELVKGDHFKTYHENALCRQDSIKWQVFFNEFFCSFIFIFFFLLIRNFKIEVNNSMVGSFLKPILVVIAFENCKVLNSKTTQGNMNPNMAIASWIWSSTYD